MDFVASLFKSLVWPATVLILVFSFRVLIKRVLANLTRVKYGDLQMDFGRELKQVQKEAIAANILPQQSVAPVKKDPLQLLEEATRLADQFPEPAIAVAWQAVEVQLADSVARLQAPKRHEHLSLGTALSNAQVLVKENVIDSASLDVLRRMHNLRNLAVHGGRGGFPITTDEAHEFLALAKGIVKKLRELRLQ